VDIGPTRSRPTMVSLAPAAGRDEPPGLPVPLTSFVGREREVAALAALLCDPATRLVTLTGAGGVGKTRLALRAASQLMDEGSFADGVFFVDLSSVRDPGLVIPVIAQSLTIRGAGQESPRAALQTFLRHRHFLLILDNFEQVSEAGPAVTDLLQACPRLSVLITSRALLNLSGEQALPVPPLSLEAPSSSGSQSSSSEAVRLFVERTRAVHPGFALTATNEPIIAEIVRRLDGIPLAIELAAARGMLLSPAALLARLERLLPHLIGGPRDRPERHQTMHAAIAWSYDLLTAEEQRVLRCLGVFAGGCALEAAAAICAQMEESPDHRGDATSFAVETTLESLARQNLVRVVAPPEDGLGNGPIRVVMLETIRELALEQLAAQDEEAAVRDRHAAWYLELVEELDLHHTMQGDAVRKSRLAPEQDNLRQALAWFAERGDALSFNRLSAALAIFWFDLGQFAEARVWLQQAIAHEDGVPVLTRARAWSEAGWLAMCQGELALAQAFCHQALALAREAGEPFLLAEAIFTNGILAFWQGDLARASELIEEAQRAFLAIEGEAAAPVKAAACVNLLGGVALMADDVPLAIRRGEEAVGMARALGAGADLSYALCGLGYARLQEGDVPAATACMLEATALTWTIDDDAFLARLLWAMAAVAVTGGRPEAAARLIGKADALDLHTGGTMWPNDRAVAEWSLKRLEDRLGSPVLSELRRAGASLTVEQAVAASRMVAALTLGEQRAAQIWQSTGAHDPVVTEAALALVLGNDAGGSGADIAPELARVGLTPRELEVLHLLVAGLTDREIADHLFITRRTASKHVEAILAKLGVRSRGSAVAEAQRLRLAPAPPRIPEA
jgi:predicted ATPase/DNA-binding CsgD family transcriptional regulator